MSRAFVKDDDDRPEQPILRTIGDQPNYVTPQGLSQLQDLLAEAESTGNERDARYYRERVESAEVVDPMGQPKDVVAFGASIKARDERGKELNLRIVGEDEARPTEGAISWTSPFAQALLEHKVGERVAVQRPVGSTRVEILSVDYERPRKPQKH